MSGKSKNGKNSDISIYYKPINDLYIIQANKYTGVQKFLYTIEIFDFFNTKDLISRQQTNLSR